MQWKMLPWAGGIMDQDPMILEMFDIIQSEKGKADKEEMEKRKRETQQKRSSGGIKRPHRRR
jgi:hypothetical protein